MNVLTLLSCHSNSPIKIQAILHNLDFLWEISETIVLINSHEFNGILEPKITDKTVIVNDVLTDELCWAYKMNNADLKDFSVAELKSHWKDCGRQEKRKLGFPTRNLYFEYAPNDKFIAHGKWLSYLNKTNCAKYDQFVLTNDSFVISRSLCDFKKLMDPATEMVALLDSNERSHHYPDFLRAYNPSGLTKLTDYFQRQKQNITDFESVIALYEIGSSHLFNSVRVLFRSPQAPINIHFNDAALADYLYTRNYPVVKIKKITMNVYPNNEFPYDFDSQEYKMLHADLNHFSDEAAMLHFVNCGMNEGRFYKKTQQFQTVPLLKNYLELVGFKT